MKDLPSNYVSLRGLLTHDPKRFDKDVKRPFAILSVATVSSYIDYTMEKAFKKTIYHNRCLVFDEVVLALVNDLEINQKVHIEGELEYRKLTTLDGNIRNAASVIVNSVTAIE